MARYNKNSGRNRDGGFNLDGVNQTHFSEQDAHRGHTSQYEHSSNRHSSNHTSTSRASHTNQSEHIHRSASSEAAHASRERRRAAELDSHNYNRRSGNSGAHVRISEHAQHTSSHAPHASTHSHHGIASSTENVNEYSRDGASARYASKKRKGRRRPLKIIIAVLIILLLGAGTAAALWYFNIAGNLKGDQNISNVVEEKASEPYYILLLGGDSRADSKKDNRTDSIMLARVDEQNKKVSLMSIPRDLRVKISGHGYCKINAAIEYGGYDQVISTVNSLFGIQINYYAFIYFSGFKDLVNKLGGVTVDVPEGTYYRGVTVPAGKNVRINGKEALVLARCRHGNPPDQGAYAMGDYQRTLNQRNLIKAIAKEILAKNPTEYPSLITGLSECVETNMDVSKLISVASNMKGMDVNSIDAAQLPEAGDIVGGEWFAALYEDVFQVMKSNFVSGKTIKDGCANFDSSNNGNNESKHCVDGELYAYCNYTKLYGDFKG